MLCTVGAQVAGESKPKGAAGTKWRQGEELGDKDRPTVRNAMLIFRAQGTKKFFAMNLNLRAEEKAS